MVHSKIICYLRHDGCVYIYMYIYMYTYRYIYIHASVPTFVPRFGYYQHTQRLLAGLTLLPGAWCGVLGAMLGLWIAELA